MEINNFCFYSCSRFGSKKYHCFSPFCQGSFYRSRFVSGMLLSCISLTRNRTRRDKQGETSNCRNAQNSVICVTCRNYVDHNTNTVDTSDQQHTGWTSIHFKTRTTVHHQQSRRPSLRCQTYGTLLLITNRHLRSENRVWQLLCFTSWT